ncbi:MAG: methyltransferase family protein [Gemmatimonadales bacterium]
MPDAKPDTSGVVLPPPFIYAGGFALGYVLHQLYPVALFGTTAAGPRRLVGWGLIAVWVALSGSAVFLFRRAGTSPIPIKPTTALVVHGPYRFTRNPMYIGLAALYLGITLLVNTLWPLVFLPVVLVVVQRRVIAREEAYLERTFGEDYRAYQARVRRWL